MNRIDRLTAMIRDPFGYRWSFTEMVEETSAEEMERRAEQTFVGGS